MQWHEIKDWATDRLTQYRERNDGDMDAIQTAMLRGRIAVIKELLALPDQQKILDAQVKAVLPE